MSTKQLIQELKTIRQELEVIKSASVEVMDSESAASFLKMSVSEFNQITRPGNMLINCSKPGGKKKLFLRKDLIAYVERFKTHELSV